MLNNCTKLFYTFLILIIKSWSVNTIIDLYLGKFYPLLGVGWGRVLIDTQILLALRWLIAKV